MQLRKRQIVAWSVWRRAVTSGAADRLTHNFRSETRGSIDQTLELKEARPNISEILVCAAFRPNFAFFIYKWWICKDNINQRYEPAFLTYAFWNTIVSSACKYSVNNKTMQKENKKRLKMKIISTGEKEVIYILFFFVYIFIFVNNLIQFNTIRLNIMYY